MIDHGTTFIALDNQKGLTLRIGMKQPMYLTLYKSARGTLDELYVHEDIGEEAFLNRWFRGYWFPRIKVSFKHTTKFSLKWLIFGFDIDKF